MVQKLFFFLVDKLHLKILKEKADVRKDSQATEIKYIYNNEAGQDLS